MSSTAGVGADARRRPKDRKQQIARASAEAFSELGYHAVSMEDIASRVGVTAASLYRHYAGKYELFRAAVLGLGEQLVSCTDFVDDDPSTPAEQLWDSIVDALIQTTLRNRSSGGLYRWEGRYLQAADQAQLNEQIKLVNRRLQRPLSELRPGLASRERWTLSSAVLSVIGSITDHRAKLPTDDVRMLLARMARDIRAAELPGEAVDSTPLPALPIGAAGDYEKILHSAMVLFNERGYRETGMDDIAAATGLPLSSIYRFFGGKSAILASVYRRAADRVSGDLALILATTGDHREVVGRLIDAYIWRSFVDPQLAYVYYAERVNVPAEDQVALHNIQRATVEAWVQQVVGARPQMPAAQARFAVHAAFGLVVDLGRLARYENSESSRLIVGRLLRVILLGPDSAHRSGAGPG
ncbi:TetR/AcrR family transcriptional regulator [Mycobacterium sp. IDR2000157661]|uniref:TetR/AcrR family transcriptional regulator n=1 Tax=Mycobacterium sp. IDR2000157661 TaxID=2867005 RepID=UPI001EEBE36B|nr:TetR/AcrR family transcriptional regulator [Mycobacterium sp. IDR2000157661]ULE34500.1 TetR/AcrR family transcriptional regulator [Mycobacterium sp. IDR2000157661]